MWSGSGEGPLLNCTLLSSGCVLTWQKEGETALWGFIRALILFLRAPPSGPNDLPRAPPPKTVALGVNISTYEFVCVLGGGGHKHSAHCNYACWRNTGVH